MSESSATAETAHRDERRSWRTRFSRAEWIRLGGFSGGVLFLHLLGWGLFLYYARTNPALAGLGTLAYTFGLRHAFDADHIAAIDNTTRKLLQDGKRPLGVGFFFSLGHSTVVLLARDRPRDRRDDGQLEDPGLPELRRLHRRVRLRARSCSSSALLNLFVLLDILGVYKRMKRGHYDEQKLEDALANQGLMSRFFLKRVGDKIDASWKMYPLGILFGLGFDTASEIGLLAVAAGVATHHVPLLAVVSLPIIFAAGMSLMDTADGAFMSQAYGWAFSNPIRKVYYNITVTSLSVAVALIDRHDRADAGDGREVLARQRLLGLPRRARLRPHRLRRRRPVRAHLGVLGRALEDAADRGALGRHGRRADAAVSAGGRRVDPLARPPADRAAAVIWDVLVERGDRHVSAAELADAVRERAPELHRSTVYRTLDVLVEDGPRPAHRPRRRPQLLRARGRAPSPPRRVHGLRRDRARPRRGDRRRGRVRAGGERATGSRGRSSRSPGLCPACATAGS